MSALTRLFIALVVGILIGIGFSGLAAAQDQESDVIIGLPGKLRVATGEDFSFYFDAADGTTYGIVGETPDVQSQIDEYGQSNPVPTIKVWGKTQPSSVSPDITVIVAASVLGPDYILPSQRPTPVVPAAAVNDGPGANVRSGPGTDYPVIGGLAAGDTCDVIGRSTVPNWWELGCVDGLIGWVFGDLLTITGSTAATPYVDVAPPPPPTATPVPVATATPAPPAPPQAQVGQWLATYYGNTGLAEPLLISRIEGQGGQWPLNYEWSLNSPIPGTVPENNWSARWSGTFYFDPGDYRFLARGNTGVRVYINGQRVIEAWPNNQDTVSNVFHGLGGGTHQVTVEFFKQGGLAWVRAWWQKDNSTSGGGRYEHRDE